jgi:signal transduction histidine kinase/FixJ family two-component response regulator
MEELTMPKILVVDDDQQIVTRLVKFFRLEGWVVASASNGQEALDALDSSYDAVILDLSMPVMNGERAFEEIKKRFDLEGLCVVILTAFGEVDSAVRIIRNGAYQYLQKPFAADNLLRILIAGITNQKANTLRRKLLTTLDENALQDHIYSIVTETINPKGLYLVFLSPDGSIQTIKGTNHNREEFIRRSRERLPAFLRHILDTKQYVFADDASKIGEWEPFLPDSRSLLAVPVPGNNDTITGVIDIESPTENAFDRNWIDVMRHLAELAGISMEITQKARLTAELQAEREHWRRIRMVVRELEHQISNPAHVITLQVQTLVSKELKSDALAALPDELTTDIRRRIEIISKNAGAIDKVCDYLRDDLRDIPIKKERADLVEILETCIEEYLTEFYDNRIDIEFPNKPGASLFMEVDSGLIKYSVQCLISNAVEAIQQRREQQSLEGEAAGPRDGGRDRIRIILTVNESRDQVCLTIQDTGIGIPPENRDLIFEPLFTTKGPEQLGKGARQPHATGEGGEGSAVGRKQFSGMGLFSVKRIINQHEGTIEAASDPGQGATFTILLPLRSMSGPRQARGRQ